MYWVTSCKKRFLWLVGFTALITFGLLLQLQYLWKPLTFEQHSFWNYDLNVEEPPVQDQTCQFPRVHPFDQSILRFLSPPREIKCKQRQPSLTFIDDGGILRFNWTSIKENGYVAEKLECYYQTIQRENDFKVSYGNQIRFTANGSEVIESDFVYVSCLNFVGMPFYSNIHCHVAPKVKLRRDSGKKIPYNVLIIGIDSMSRLSFIRQLPKTYSFLTKDLNAFVFRGATKVGDNTFPNLVALLTGKSLDGELPKIEDPNEPYDSFPCLWKDFSQAGFATLYAEDMPNIGLFNYFRGGLKKVPTDHYMRTFWLAVQTSKLHLLSSNLCFGNVPKHLLQLNYTKDFVEKYAKSKTPYFGFSFQVELSHDYVSQVSAADDDFESWLSYLFYSGLLNDTFLIFMSDHGHRFDAMRATLIGRIEERMPFLSIVVPPSLYQSHPQVIETLKLNVLRLVTPYDIYFTAMDILSHSVNGTGFGSATSPRGTSLLGPVSLNRTCESAGIPDHYCVCEVEEMLDEADPRSVKAADTLIETLNEVLSSKYSDLCSELYLSQIVRSDLIRPRKEVIVNSIIYFGKHRESYRASGMISKLRIIIKTTPGAALFEATLQYREDDDSYSVLGDVSRINQYGSQSSCISDAVLKKYCFCANATTESNL